MNRTIMLPLAFATFGAFGMAMAAPAPAQMMAASQNLDELEQIVVTTLGADVGQPGGPLAPIDRRMRLTACPTGIQIDPPANNAVTVRCTTAGWRLRVPLKAGGYMAQQGGGQMMSPMAQRAPDIRKGDPVQLVAQGDAFSISVDAVAMEDANIGGRVRVQTGNNRGTMFAQVVDIGRVRLMGFK
ncbi:flagella basal body P-ring formation protein FlgA [Sphingomonas crocodyli]|uniref:Flagellar protein n=1 Tax=Sphingomonas crocodyli TaxID=1979270 RepID=A0A437MAG1_9SPHN|nr:flagella basal body P-ring formation protein FlgA [Sphingomonas crocodyli]RVT94640.1 flagellar protein [Sphingomonas crocodyli]